MSVHDELTAVQRCLDELFRSVKRLEQQPGSGGLDMRRVRTDADHLRESVALLRDDRPGPAKPGAPTSSPSPTPRTTTACGRTRTTRVWAPGTATPPEPDRSHAVGHWYGTPRHRIPYRRGGVRTGRAPRSAPRTCGPTAGGWRPPPPPPGCSPSSSTRPGGPSRTRTTTRRRTSRRSTRPCLAENCEPMRGGPNWDLFGSWWGISPAIIILIFPLGFRLTCYYYRKAYYRGFWASPPACAVAEPHKKYSGETRFPLILQNIHRYFFYAAILVAGILTYDTVLVLPRRALRVGPHGPRHPRVPGQHRADLGVHPLLPLLPAHRRRQAQALLQAPRALPGCGSGSGS